MEMSNASFCIELNTKVTLGSWIQEKQILTDVQKNLSLFTLSMDRKVWWGWGNCGEALETLIEWLHFSLNRRAK